MNFSYGYLLDRSHSFLFRMPVHGLHTDRQNVRLARLDMIAEVRNRYPSFLPTLLEVHPSLKPVETDICCCELLRYERADAAWCIGLEIHTLENRITKVRKKLNLDSPQALYNYLLRLGIAVPPPDVV